MPRGHFRTSTETGTGMIQTPPSAFTGTRKGAPRSRARRLLPGPISDHFATSALGFMPYFANGYGLQLSTQVPVTLGPHHTNHFVPRTGDAGPETARQHAPNASSFSSSYAPSPLGAIAPWYEHDSRSLLDQTSQSSRPPALDWANSAFATAVPPMQGDAKSYSASSASQPSTFSSSSPSLHRPHHAMSSLRSLEESITNAGDSSFRAGCVVRDDAPGHFLDQVNAHLTYTQPLLGSSQRFQDSQPGSQYSYYTNYRPSSASASSSSSAMQGSPYPDSYKHLCPNTYRRSTPGEHLTPSSAPTSFAARSQVYLLLLAQWRLTRRLRDLHKRSLLAACWLRECRSQRSLPSTPISILCWVAPELRRPRRPEVRERDKLRHPAKGRTGCGRARKRRHLALSRVDLPGLLIRPLHRGHSPPPRVRHFLSPFMTQLVRPPSATPSPASTPAGTPLVANVKDLPMIKQGRVLVESDAFCSHCHRMLASLILRGKEEQFQTPHRADFICFTCQPPIDDKGVPVIPQERPPQGRGKIAFAGSKKRKVNVEPLTCDVCQRDLAAGGLSSQPTNLPVELMIEVVCVSCAAKYQRCSDCGGGGGGRVGIGKWRCKELFRDGRRNCSLSHVRQGPHDVQAYEIWSTSQVPPEELDSMIAAMRDVTISAIMSMGAIPDILEAPTPLARTYDELQRYAVDTWSVFEPLVRMVSENRFLSPLVYTVLRGCLDVFVFMIDQDQSAEPYIRRYFALRWTTPHKRKKKGAADLKVEPASARTSVPETGPEPSDGRVVMRKNKTLASFIFGELDLRLGSAFPMLVMPKGIGDAYDQNTILMQKMLDRMTKDVAEGNATRIRNRQTPWPKLDEVWTMGGLNLIRSPRSSTAPVRAEASCPFKNISPNDPTASTTSHRTEHATSLPN
ncbi:BZ3500_MvSof-1268-A1-R1_Chr12-2g03915 [Microbotryum saponariae]|uniref:BZ3500_MvSof-1268-A1-R1_Chr12-2g03915 protein n=1 Tax=Microbotryum saponariae TaxID=289078 RepID=A0A2X0LER2_9BASI|nr:BZ3500_MvSof-1268-A1-R1_Chr12-2g03915 [Microbotryum saponariae]